MPALVILRFHDAGARGGSSDISPFGDPNPFTGEGATSLHFAIGSPVGTQSCTNFTINDDGQVEDDEIFKITLDSTLDVIQGEQFLEYTIIDNDG